MIINILSISTLFIVAIMSSLENVHPDCQISESVRSIENVALFADHSIVQVIYFMKQWPQDEVVSLEEGEKSLIVLAKVKKFALDLLQVLTFAQDAIWKTSKSTDSLLMSTVFESILNNCVSRIGIVYTEWCRYVAKVESWVKFVVDSEEKWKSLITVETPAALATDASLNSMAETSQTQPPLHLFTKIRAHAKLPVKSHVVTRLYLGKANDLDWNLLKKRYTQQEVEALRAMVDLVDRAGKLLGWNEKAKMVKESAPDHYDFMDESLVQSLYQWNLMRKVLLATEPFQLRDVQAIDLTGMSKEEVVNVVKDMIMFADRAIANFIPSVRKNMNSQVGSWQERDGCRTMLTAHWLQPFFSTRQVIYETAKAIDGLLSKVDTDDERKTWLGIRERVQVVYEDWHRYVEEVENQVNSEETKQKYTNLMDTVEKLLNWRSSVKIRYSTETGVSRVTWSFYMNEPLVKSLYKWFQVRAMLLDLETSR
jgi:hypothetical protein